MRVLVYGGCGQLGKVVGNKLSNHEVLCVDFIGCCPAEGYFGLDPKDDPKTHTKQVMEYLGGKKVDAIICVAGGWAGGSLKDDGVFDSVHRMIQMNVNSSIICGVLAHQCLSDKGVVIFTGAAAALSPCPGMIGYSVSKVSTHYIMQSLAKELPDHFVAAIAPITLDTASNRAGMPDADYKQWTPLEYVAGLMVEWVEGKNRPSSGSIVKLTTKDGETSLSNH